MYSFRSQVAGSATRTPLADEQQTNSYTTFLPVGAGADNYTLVGWSDVADCFGAITDTSNALQVQPLDYSTNNASLSLSGGTSSRRRALLESRGIAGPIRSLLGVSSTWSLTAFLANTSEARVQDAVDAGNPETCMQALSSVASMMNTQNSSDAVEATARQALREHMLSSLMAQCTAMMELTTTTATQRAAVLSAIVDDGSELGASAQYSALKLAHSLAVSVDNAGDGLDHDAALEISGTLAAVLRIRNSVFAYDDDDDGGDALGGASQRRSMGWGNMSTSWGAFADAINLTDTTKALCSAMLMTSQFAGAESHVATDVFALACYRESIELIDGFKVVVPSTSEMLRFPSNFSSAAHLSKSGDDFVDLRLASFGRDLFATANASINGGVTGFSAHEALFGDAVVVSLSEPIILTLGVREPYNVSFQRFSRTCYGHEVLSLDCPLGKETYTCNATDTYFVEATCPGLVPTCLSWDWQSLEWRDDSCSVANYTSLNVTCECTSMVDMFGVGTNVSSLLVAEMTTFEPSQAPTSLPTASPTPSPTTPAPTPFPSDAPTLSPSSTPAPTSGPSSLPSLTPTVTARPTQLPTLAPSHAPTLTPHPTPVPSTPSPTITARPTLAPNATAFPTYKPSLIQTLQAERDPTPVPTPVPTAILKPSIPPTLAFQSATVILAISGVASCDECESNVSLVPLEPHHTDHSVFVSSNSQMIRTRNRR